VTTYTLHAQTLKDCVIASASNSAAAAAALLDLKPVEGAPEKGKGEEDK